MIEVGKHNYLILGDNLRTIELLPDNCIDLIYLDPPWQTKRRFIAVDDIKNQILHFEDHWKDIETYTRSLSDRLVHFRRVLKPTGSIFLHCDRRANYMVRKSMDKVFGKINFRNEIIWAYKTGGASRRFFAHKHDTIFFYSKTENYKFNPLREDRISDSMKRAIQKDDEIFTDEQGNKYTWHTRPGRNPKHPSGTRIYLQSLLRDVWTDIPALHHNSKLRTGWSTQKPTELVERIISSTTDPGDTVYDPYVGSGTTCRASYNLARFYIGADHSASAISICIERMKDLPELIIPGLPELTSVARVIKYKYEYNDLREMDHFDFEVMIVKALGGVPTKEKPGADGGVDGRITGKDRAIIDAKRSDNVGVGVVRQFVTSIKAENFNKGILVAFSFTKGAKMEASRLKNDENIDIQLTEVKKIFDINFPVSLDLNVNGNSVEAVAKSPNGEIVNFMWWIGDGSSTPFKYIDTTGIFELKQGMKVITCKVTDEMGSETIQSIEV